MNKIPMGSLFFFYFGAFSAFAFAGVFKLFYPAAKAFHQLRNFFTSEQQEHD